MPEHFKLKSSPFMPCKTGCFSVAATIVAALLTTMTVSASAQSLSDKLMQDMARDSGQALRKLTPLQKDQPSLRPDNKIPQRPPLRLPAEPQQKSPAAPDADFDFYVLSLSWSPSFCAENGRRGNARQQCGSGRAYGFVAHGLWPQYERGYPESCNHAQANDQVPRDVVSALSDIMPSAGLMRHEWRKHGTCAGLNQRDYFTTLRNAYQAVTIPPALRTVAAPRSADPQLIEKAFIAANPALPANAIAVTCSRNRLQEVRICMDKGLKFRACKEVDRNACRSRSVTLPPNR